MYIIFIYIKYKMTLDVSYAFSDYNNLTSESLDFKELYGFHNIVNWMYSIFTKTELKDLIICSSQNNNWNETLVFTKIMSIWENNYSDKYVYISCS
jgi:hypothetical protein